MFWKVCLHKVTRGSPEWNSVGTEVCLAMGNYPYFKVTGNPIGAITNGACILATSNAVTSFNRLGKEVDLFVYSLRPASKDMD